MTINIEECTRPDRRTSFYAYGLFHSLNKILFHCSALSPIMAEVYREQLEEMTTLHEVAKIIEQNVRLHTTITIFKLELQLEALFHSPYSLGISSTDHRFFQN